MIPSTSSSTPTTPINGLGITRDKVRDTLMRLVQGFTTYGPVLSFKMGKQEVLRKWSSSMNAYLVVCILLKELCCIGCHNGISKMEGLSTLVNLRILDISSNKLTAVDDIEKLTRLEDLWMNDNQIASLDGLDLALAGSRDKLTTIYVEHNPCANFPNYTNTLRQFFPNLEQIDSYTFS
ncbi:hypothetical protein IFM89_007880 [Coptis chinensis]|uniref:Uncharacterized protein n=1 Tax=Coptis chinensis TaxID=261450 RepID=A0A835LHW8_9MAGN|nr:hypothetical protein IFM89_007880 [Coptis chinensis]